MGQTCWGNCCPSWGLAPLISWFSHSFSWGIWPLLSLNRHFQCPLFLWSGSWCESRKGWRGLCLLRIRKDEEWGWEKAALQGILELSTLRCFWAPLEALDSVSPTRHSWRGMIKFEPVLVISALDVFSYLQWPPPLGPRQLFQVILSLILLNFIVSISRLKKKIELEWGKHL